MTVIETTGEAVETPVPTEEKPKIDVKDVPIYTVARAVEWIRRPENTVKVEQFAQRAGEAQRKLVNQIGDRVAEVKDLWVGIATDDSIAEDFTNAFLRSIIGDD